jgi:hypothetical protein
MFCNWLLCKLRSQVSLFICLIVFHNVKGEIRHAKYTKRNTGARGGNQGINKNATMHLCFFHIISQMARFFFFGGGGGGN